MKDKVTNHVGIDISKSTLDISLLKQGKLEAHVQIKNKKAAINKIIKSWIKLYEFTIEDTVYCMEHTGMYGHHIISILSSMNVKLWVESGAQINKSIGVVRGKDDKVDSFRIADYAYCNLHKAKWYVSDNESLTRLKVLSSERKRLQKIKKQLEVPLQEQKTFYDSSILENAFTRTDTIVEKLTQSIKEIEDEMKQVIAQNKELNRQYKFATSVVGVGLVTAIEVIVNTKAFTKIKEAKQYACYSGVVPFTRSSGSSIRGRARVSHLANKSSKSILHMAALSAITVNGEMRDYFLRKVEEGKNKMLVLNAVRNKIIHRIFACVNNNEMYSKNYQHSLA